MLYGLQASRASALGKDLSLEIGRGLELDVTTRMGVEELRDALAKSKRAKLDAIVQESLPRDTLKETCDAVGLDDTGKEKAALVERILAAGGGKTANGVGYTTAPSATKTSTSAEGGAAFGALLRCWSGENRAMNRATMARFSNQATTSRPSMCRLAATEPEVHARVRGGAIRARHRASAACTIDHQITLIGKLSTMERRHAKAWECEATELLQKDQQLAPAERAFDTFDAIRRALPTPAEKRRAQREATRPTPTDGFGEGGLVPKAGGAG